MNDTVTLFKSTAFFASWSETSMQRLYFWFKRKRLAPGEDVVTQARRRSRATAGARPLAPDRWRPRTAPARTLT
eukprot:7128547-Prymnesium_polylepis.1